MNLNLPILFFIQLTPLPVGMELPLTNTRSVMGTLIAQKKMMNWTAVINEQEEMFERM